MYTQKDLLLQSAARLYTLGVDLEGARETLRRLVSMQMPYDSPQMIAALQNFEELEMQWKELELQHLGLKTQMDIRTGNSTRFSIDT